MVTDSVVVLVVRKGNPKNIQTWDDLLQEGVEVITPNPFTSGGARWNVMAAYGAQLEQGKTEEEAVDYLRAAASRTSAVQDKSARESLQTFAGGKGDVLIAYENEAITAQQKGEEIDYVVPDQTILIENPVAVVTRASTPSRRRRSSTSSAPRGAADLRREGLPAGRRGRPRTVRLPAAAGLFTIEDLGGWDEVTAKFFDRDDGHHGRRDRARTSGSRLQSRLGAALRPPVSVCARRASRSGAASRPAT